MDWSAHAEEGPTEWARGTVALTIFRRDPEGGGEQLTGWDEHGGWVTEKVEPWAQLRPGFPIPKESFEALVRQARPGPSERELAQLKEALDVERARLDRTLERLTPFITWPDPPVPATLESFEGDEARQGVELLDRDAVRSIARDLATACGPLASATTDDMSRWADRLFELAGPA